MRDGVRLGPGSTGPRRDGFDGCFRVESQAAARALVATNPSSIGLVHRDVDQAAVFRCPCRCGDVLSINLDPRTGKAWRLRQDRFGVTLLPSVWRTSGCKSHFILWRNAVWWCRAGADDDTVDEAAWPAEMDRELRNEWRRLRGIGRGDLP